MSATFNLALPPPYETDTTVYVQPVLPEAAADPAIFQPYWRTLQLEYAVDDLSVLVRQRSFAEHVGAEVGRRFGGPLRARDVMDSITRSSRRHRTLKVTVVTSEALRTTRIAEAVNTVLERDAPRMLSPEPDRLTVSVIDPPHRPAPPALARRLQSVLFHGLLALVAGFAWALGRDKLDPVVRRAEDAAELTGWRVIGTLPAQVDGRARGRTRLARFLSKR